MKFILGGCTFMRVLSAMPADCQPNSHKQVGAELLSTKQIHDSNQLSTCTKSTQHHGAISAWLDRFTLSSVPIKARGRQSFAPHLRLVADVIFFVAEHPFSL
ncbi:hypothetical protein P692DRAFT_20130263 [Suillus brevipes Sb2]|nr:hypothetical protein P692DRAFT_20130263 [Suillus brevipes Sb2]